MCWVTSAILSCVRGACKFTNCSAVRFCTRSRGLNSATSIISSITCGTGSLTRVGMWFHSFVVANLCCRNGFQHRWCDFFAKGVGRALLGRRLAFPRPMGCCALAHIILLLERPEEVLAARRALFLPHQDGAFCSHRGSLRRRSRLVL